MTRQLLIDAGYCVPIHRHHLCHEVICLSFGSLLVKEFEIGGQPAGETLMIAGDAYRVPCGRWHQIVAIRGSSGIILHWPGEPLWDVYAEDYEEWKPDRIIGRG